MDSAYGQRTAFTHRTPTLRCLIGAVSPFVPAALGTRGFRQRFPRARRGGAARWPEWLARAPPVRLEVPERVPELGEDFRTCPRLGAVARMGRTLGVAAQGAG